MGTALKRTTISLTQEQHEELRRLASERRTSMARLLRDAVVEMLEDAEDIREGMRALEGGEGTMSWEEFQRGKRERSYDVGAQPA